MPLVLIQVFLTVALFLLKQVKNHACNIASSLPRRRSDSSYPRYLFSYRYIYEVARRSPMVNVIVVLNAAKKYDAVMETCCHAEDKDACFQEKVFCY